MAIREISIFLLFRPPKIRMCPLQFLTFRFRTILARPTAYVTFISTFFFCINLARRSAKVKWFLLRLFFSILCQSLPRDCKTLMMAVGLVWSNELRSYAGGSNATGRASLARLGRDEDPDYEAIQSVLQDC